MTRNYMHQWRIRRLLARDPCECGGGPRVGMHKGCARCEEMDRLRYRNERNRRVTTIARRRLAQFDSVSLPELAIACGVTDAQMRYALRRLIESDEVEVLGAGNATEYRLKQRRAA